MKLDFMMKIESVTVQQFKNMSANHKLRKYLKKCKNETNLLSMPSLIFGCESPNNSECTLVS